MSLITRMLKQTAVYWALANSESGGVARDDNGQPLLASPAEISVRWEDKVMEFIDALGARQLSQAIVYVASDVSIGGVLMLGELTDITDAVNVKENDGAYEIRGFQKVPNIRATEFLRAAIL